MKKRSEEIIGWIGVLLILASFILSTIGLISPKDLSYGVINAIGAIGIIISSFPKKDFQPILLNSVWLIVALFGIFRSIF